MSRSGDGASSAFKNVNRVSEKWPKADPFYGTAGLQAEYQMPIIPVALTK